MSGDASLKFGDPVGVAVEEVEHVLLGADRALDAPQRVGGEQVDQPAVGHQEVLCGVGEALAQRRRLGGDVVAASCHHEVGVLGGEAPQSGEGGDDPVQDQFEATADLELFDVLGEVARRHALVDVLMAGKGAELLDAGLHVVAGDLLAPTDRLEVDLIDHRPVVGDDPVGEVDTEVPLGLEDSHPELALEHDLALGRPELGHGPTGIAGGEDVLHGSGGLPG